MSAAAGVRGRDLPASVEDRRLAARHRLLLLVIALPIFLLVAVLGNAQYRQYRTHLLETLKENDRSIAHALDAVAKQASDHVLRMQAWQTELLRHPPRQQSPLRAHFKPRMADGQPDGFTLDSLPQAQRAAAGQILWSGAGAPQLRPHQLEQAEAFFAIVRLTHSVTPQLQWSYYFAPTRDQVNLYPWASSHDMFAAPKSVADKAAGKQPDTPRMLGLLPGYFDYEIYTGGTPARNAARKPYWVAPYIDAGGTGPMVSHGAPVYLDNRFAGIVGTDFRLATLQEFLAQWPVVGRLLIVDDKGHVLADTRGLPQDRLLRIDQLGVHGLTQQTITQALQRKGGAIAQRGWFTFAHGIEHAPWRLVHIVTEEELHELSWPRAVPYVLILVVLAFAFVLSLQILRTQFISPALRLIDYLQRASVKAEATPPDMPALWRPWVDVITRVFSDHRDALVQLKAGEAFKAAIVENAMLAVVSVDRDGNIREFNRAAEHIFGFTQQQAIGQDLAELIIPPRYRDAHRNGMRRHLNTGESRVIGAHLQLEALHARGHEFPIELTIFVTPVGDHQFYTAFISDLTLRQQAEQEVARQREALRQSEKLSAMGALLAGVAHELNNPLAILMGRAALLEGKAKDPAVRDDAARIRAAADRCGRIVRTFLSMARHRPSEKKPGRVNDVVTGAIELLAYNLRSSGIEVVQQFDTDLPPIEMDSDQIGQVVVNLIVNAQQVLVTHAGPRQLRIVTTAQGDDQVVRVIDNGPGVPEALRERIFEPFFTTKSEEAGTGIGLSVSRAIMREHGGELLLEPVGAGASFVLRLPASRPGTSPTNAPAAEAQPQAHEGLALVIDDDAEVGAVLADILRSAGYMVQLATSGHEALAWLQANPCDMIFSDVRMPDMDGITLWRAIRERWPAMVGHMAFVTGDMLSAHIAPLLDETGLPCLEKPFLPEDVLMLAARIEAPRD